MLVGNSLRNHISDGFIVLDLIHVEAQVAEGWDEVVSVTTSVKNTGAVAGSEVAQLYVSYPEEASQPPKQLRGFEKVSLQQGMGGIVCGVG